MRETRFHRRRGAFAAAIGAALFLGGRVAAWIDCDVRLARVDVDPTQIRVMHRIDGQPIEQQYTATDRGILNLLFGDEWSGRLYTPDSLDPESLRGLRVCDAGAGRGRLVRELRALGAVVEGFDLRYLGRVAGPLPEGVFGADLTAIPRPAGSYDVIFANQTVFSYPNSRALRVTALRELRRLLAPGGVVRLSPVPLHRLLDDLRDCDDLEIRLIRYGDRERLRAAADTVLRPSEDDTDLAEVVLAVRGEAIRPIVPPAATRDLAWKLRLIGRTLGEPPFLSPLRPVDHGLSLDDVTTVLDGFRRDRTPVELFLASPGGRSTLRGRVTGLGRSANGVPTVRIDVTEVPLRYVAELAITVR